MTTKPLPNRLKLTHADYLLFPDDLCRHEILDGEHVRTRAPGLLHQEVLMDLLGQLWGWVQDSGLGEVLLGPLCVVLSEHDIVEPDLMFIARENRDRITDDNVQGAPDLVIEILCEETRKIDEVLKRHIYEAHGVQEYWIPDPELETIKVYRRQGAGFGPATVLAAERADALTTPLLPGFELPLAKIFAS